jgi:DNA-binding PadR family transcriptional regulator
MRWLLLSLISDKPRHGYELIKQIEAGMGGTYAPSPGVIYPSLTLLEDMGALTVEAQGGKKLHVITDEGLRLLDENAEAVAHIKRKMAALSGRSERPAEVQTALDAFRSAVRTRLGPDQALSEEQAQALARLIRDMAEKVSEI